MQNRRTTWFGHIKQMLCIGIGSVLAGVLLLTLVFCIPVGVMARHVGASVDKILVESPEPSDGWLKQYIYEKKESYTDAIMVQNAIEKIPGKNAYEHAMWAYHLDLDAEVWTPEVSVEYFSKGGDTSVMFLHQYSRYWHGYLVYLKPLLLLFTWEQILWIGGALQVLLFLVVLIVSFKSGHPEVGIALLLSLLFMKPLLMLVSLDMAVCWLITLIAVLAILLKYDWLKRKEHFPELFLMTGILVAYFDFLTYPVVTLGFPLCVFFLMKDRRKPEHRLYTMEVRGTAFFLSENLGGLLENVGQMLAYSACWALGYVSMWAAKWVVADLTLHAGTIKSAFSSILGWTEAIGGRPRVSGGFYVISLNLQEYDFWIYPFLIVLVTLFDVAAFVYASKKTSLKEAISLCVPYLLTACIPFGWYVVVQHHSGLHVSFTFRIISVAWLALCAIGLGLFCLGRKETAISDG